MGSVQMHPQHIYMIGPAPEAIQGLGACQCPEESLYLLGEILANPLKHFHISLPHTSWL